jgi:hypothetical protein
MSAIDRSRPRRRWTIVQVLRWPFKLSKPRMSVTAMDDMLR